MKIFIFRDIAGILLIYALYATVTVLMYGPDSFTESAPPVWPIVMLACSLAGTLFWYLLGEWVIRPNASGTAWYGTWFALLALILGCACYVAYMELSETPADWNPWLHFLGGAGAYYFSTVLFSPLFGKYHIWPARLVRKW
jgi:hypothetical protein